MQSLPAVILPLAAPFMKQHVALPATAKYACHVELVKGACSLCLTMCRSQQGQPWLYACRTCRGRDLSDSPGNR